MTLSRMLEALRVDGCLGMQCSSLNVFKAPTSCGHGKDR